jgi:uncharacterized protein YegP (UPF0339 family)
MTEYHVYLDVNSQWRWRLISSSNGKIISNSGEGYHNKADCLHGLALNKGSSGSPVKE